MNPLDEYPRPLTPRERELVDLLLPTDRSGYRAMHDRIESLVVLGRGRWGEGDYVMGAPDQEVDPEAPMEPVFAVGGARLTESSRDVIISIHLPDDEGRVELHLSGAGCGELESSKLDACWTLSRWSPGDPAPLGGETVRQVSLDDSSQLLFVIAPERRQLWLHDSAEGTNRLIPVTNFYNELMLEIGERDPRIALDHRRLFSGDSDFSDSTLAAAFRRYNTSFRKVDPSRLERKTEADSGFTRRFARWFTRTGRANERAGK